MFRLSYNYGNGVGAAILQTLDSSVKIVESIKELHSKMKHSAEQLLFIIKILGMYNFYSNPKLN